MTAKRKDTKLTAGEVSETQKVVSNFRKANFLTETQPLLNTYLCTQHPTYIYLTDLLANPINLLDFTS